MNETETPEACEICGAPQSPDDPYRWCEPCGSFLLAATTDAYKWNDIASEVRLIVARGERQAVAAFIEKVKARALDAFHSGSSEPAWNAFLVEAERHAQPATTETT